MIERIPEFVSNHPLLFAALAATLGMIAFMEYQRFSRVARPISPARATRMSNSDSALFIDTRRRKDFDAGHLPGAHHVPAGEVENQLKQLEKHRDQPVIVYDDGGLDAERVAKALAKHGFSQLYALDGGMPAWRKADLPIRTPGGKDKQGGGKGAGSRGKGDKGKADKAKGGSGSKGGSGAKGQAPARSQTSSKSKGKQG